MSKIEKVIFWVATAIILVDNIFWQWKVKLSEAPAFELSFPFALGYRNLIGDIVLLGVWLFLLIKIYRKANKSG